MTQYRLKHKCPALSFFFPDQGDKCGSLKCVEAALWIVWHMGVDGRNASENVLLEQKTFQKNFFVLAS